MFPDCHLDDDYADVGGDAVVIMKFAVSSFSYFVSSSIIAQGSFALSLEAISLNLQATGEPRPASCIFTAILGLSSVCFFYGLRNDDGCMCDDDN